MKLEKLAFEIIKDLNKQFPKYNAKKISDFNKVVKYFKSKMPKVSNVKLGQVALDYNDYREGDMGVKIPTIRKMAKTLKKIGMKESVKEATNSLPRVTLNRLNSDLNIASGLIMTITDKYKKQGDIDELVKIWMRGLHLRLKKSGIKIESINEDWSKGLERYKVTLENGKEIDVKVKNGEGLEGVGKLLDKEGLKYEKVIKKASRPTLTNEAKFTKQQIDIMRKAYGTLSNIDPNKPTYKKFIKFLDKLPKDQLRQLDKANIKWVSTLAANRLRRIHGEQ